MASGTLYTYSENYRAYKAQIAAKYSGANVKVAQGFVFGETNKTPAFLKKFPLGKVPAFESNDGKLLTESNAIAYYVGNAQLRGQTDIEKAQIVQWMDFADSEVLPASSVWVFPCLGIMPPNKQNTDRAKADVKAALAVLDAHLLTRTFLVGERISLADISLGCTMLHLFQYVLDPAFRRPFPNAERWFRTFINQPNVKAIVGEFKLCEKMAEAKTTAPAAAGATATSAPAAKEGGGKKDKKKEKPKKEEAPPAEEPDEAELALAAEPKSKDPFDALPKGTWNMDDFKRCYSNEDEAKSIPYFWEKFDPANYSIWFGEYKYEEELTKVFMSCNLIGGMYQRLDKMRKCAFASAAVFGEDNNSSISGVWVWRGQELAFPLSPDWQIDYESYAWTKLDPAKEDTKQLVKQYFSWTGTDKKGRKFNQGKVFK